MWELFSLQISSFLKKSVFPEMAWSECILPLFLFAVSSRFHGKDKWDYLCMWLYLLCAQGDKLRGTIRRESPEQASAYHKNPEYPLSGAPPFSIKHPQASKMVNDIGLLAWKNKEKVLFGVKNWGQKKAFLGHLLGHSPFWSLFGSLFFAGCGCTSISKMRKLCHKIVDGELNGSHQKEQTTTHRQWW